MIEKGMLVRLRPDWRPEGMLENIREFGGCIGVVLGHPEPGWPEWDVRWEPSGLRYAYPEEALEPAKPPVTKIPTCSHKVGASWVITVPSAIPGSSPVPRSNTMAHSRPGGRCDNPVCVYKRAKAKVAKCLSIDRAA